MARDAESDEDAADRIDLKGWLMFSGFGLLWTLVSGGISTLIILSSLGIIGRDPEPLALFVYGILLAMISPGPALLSIGVPEIFATLRVRARRRAFPDKPWKWSPEWDGGVIMANAASAAFWLRR